MAAKKKSSVTKVAASKKSGTTSSKKRSVPQVAGLYKPVNSKVKTPPNITLVGDPYESESATVIRGAPQGEILGEIVCLAQNRWAYRLIYTIFVDKEGLPKTGLYSGWGDRYTKGEDALTKLIEEYDRFYTAKGEKPKIERS